MGNYSVRLTNEIPFPSIDFINQLSKDKNIRFDNSFTSAPDILKDLFYLFSKERELESDFVKSEHLLNRKVIQDKILMRPLDREENAYYLYTLNFLSKVKVEEIQGFSPMDKALNVMMFASKLSPENEGNKYDGLGTTEAEETVVTPATVAKAIKHFSEPEKDTSTPDAGSLSNDLTQCVRDFLGDLSPEIMSIYGAKTKLQMPVDLKILKDIKIKSYLESKLGMEETSEKRIVEDQSSKTKKHMAITSMSDLSKVSKAKFAMPDFKSKLAKKEIFANKKVAPVTKKQMFTMLLDDSGSMSYKLKQSYVRAVLLNRLEPVVKGHASLIFHLYESERYNKKVVNTPKECKELFDEICRRIPSGGGTHIGKVLQETVNECYDVPGYHNPEIMIVCDGDDFVDPTKIDFKGVKINVVALGNSNEGLKEVALKSGGFYTEEKMY